MIELSINIDSTKAIFNKARHDLAVSKSLKEIADLVPNHKSNDFNRDLYKKFKVMIWEQQHKKCAFCEKKINSSDDGQLEHYRPKTEVCDEKDVLISRNAYWWLAYDHKNFLVSCFTCNNIKGSRFTLFDEQTRETAKDLDGIVALTEKGSLGNEMPLIINPRFQDPEPYLTYGYFPSVKMVYVHGKSPKDIGDKTIKMLDLNRDGKNDPILKDSLPRERGIVLSEFDNELDRLLELVAVLDYSRIQLGGNPNNHQLETVQAHASRLDEKKENVRKRFLSETVQFSGMCKFWLANVSARKRKILDVAA